MSKNNKDMKEKPAKDELAIVRKAFFEFISEFKDESDRAAVILGVAKVDLLLYQILIRVLRPNTSKNDDLFDGDSPMSTYSAKINLCYRMGLIDSELTRALHLIRKIRNDFAHEVTGCKLDSGSHRDRVKELIAPLKDFDRFEEDKETFFKDDTSCSTYFRSALAHIAVGLEIFLQRVRTLDLKAHTLVPPGWLRSKSEKSSKKDDKS